MANFASNGWGVYFHPQLFATQYKELFERVSRLREQLPEAEYKTHATVKLFAAITVAIESNGGLKEEESCQLVEILLTFMLKIAQEVFLASTKS
ncbi:MAG: hypothetical protein V7K69_11590 [Nostoc sp.]|uniref:hypothetical protein n=1 Tax=Nostoc sp. TaxID=1180 RepID=UPI002FF46B80